MVTIIITIKLFHLFISALCAAVFLDSVNLTETFPVSPSLFKLLLHMSSLSCQGIYSRNRSKFTEAPNVVGWIWYSIRCMTKKVIINYKIFYQSCIEQISPTFSCSSYCNMGVSCFFLSDCWLNKTSNLMTFPWALRSCDTQ